jgi:hypothetical protein
MLITSYKALCLQALSVTEEILVLFIIFVLPRLTHVKEYSTSTCPACDHFCQKKVKTLEFSCGKRDYTIAPEWIGHSQVHLYLLGITQ